MYADLSIVRSDGTGYRTLAVGEYTKFTLTPANIVFIGGGSALYTVNYDGSKLGKLHTSLPWLDCVPALDGTQILLTGGTVFASTLYLMDNDGGNLRSLSSTPDWFTLPQVAPQGNEIVFERGFGIVTANLDGTNIQSIRAKTDSTDAWYPLYLDENHIVYTESNHNTSAYSIRMFDKTNQLDTLLIATGAAFTFSSGTLIHGDSLVFDDVGTIKVFLFSSQRTITVCQGYAATFSPDGHKVLFTLDNRIYSENIDRTDWRTLYTEQDPNKSIVFPAMSPDGQFVVFLESYPVYDK
jgi:Tol biopolymer transport system component